MNFKIKSNIKNDHILITAVGKISNFDEFKLLNKLYFEEIEKLKLNKIIVDERDLEKPLSLLNMTDLTNFYETSISHNIDKWKASIIVDANYKEVAEFWEMLTKEMGYKFKTVLSMEEALEFI